MTMTFHCGVNIPPTADFPTRVDPTADFSAEKLLTDFDPKPWTDMNVSSSEINWILQTSDYEKDPEMVQMAPFQPYAPPTSPITPPATPEPLLSSPPSAHEITMTALKSCVNARLNPTVPKVQASQAFIRPVPQVPSIIRQDSGVMRPVSIGFSGFIVQDNSRTNIREQPLPQYDEQGRRFMSITYTKYS
ncbi:hypothetical protein Fcan01_25688 [Folsomia candida]|uniref:Uncharacterized protein n=1 Tax=Folsomia candida TaxID=158441 RepID=A0A226D367_FOLCA|nr:hypothetical protein Fcan01_25688 [Folsomia candida]